MAIYTGGPDENPAIQAQGDSALPTSFGESLGAAWHKGVEEMPLSRVSAWLDRKLSPYFDSDTLSAEEANRQYGIEGHLHFDRPVLASVATNLYTQKSSQLKLQQTIENGPQGVVSSVANWTAGMAPQVFDPTSIAATLIPGVGEARVAAMLGRGALGAENLGLHGVASGLARAGELNTALGTKMEGSALWSVAGGAANGAVGMAALEPLNYLLDKDEQNDWSMGEALTNVAFGGLLGGGLHLGGYGLNHLLGHNPSPTLAERANEPTAPKLAETPAYGPAPEETTASPQGPDWHTIGEAQRQAQPSWEGVRPESVTTTVARGTLESGPAATVGKLLDLNERENLADDLTSTRLHHALIAADEEKLLKKASQRDAANARAHEADKAERTHAEAELARLRPQQAQLQHEIEDTQLRHMQETGEPLEQARTQQQLKGLQASAKRLEREMGQHERRLSRPATPRIDALTTPELKRALGNLHSRREVVHGLARKALHRHAHLMGHGLADHELDRLATDVLKAPDRNSASRIAQARFSRAPRALRSYASWAEEKAHREVIEARLKEAEAKVREAERIRQARESYSREGARLERLDRVAREAVLRESLASLASRRPNVGPQLANMFQALEAPKRPSTAPSLLAFLRRRGGLRESAGELRHMELNRARPGTVRKKGLPLDEARRLAEEAGYLRTNSDINDLLEALAQEARGQKVYPPEDAARLEQFDQQQHEHEARMRAHEEALADIAEWERESDQKLSAFEREHAARSIMDGVPAEDAIHEAGQANLAHLLGEGPHLEELPEPPTLVSAADELHAALQATKLEELPEVTEQRRILREGLEGAPEVLNDAPEGPWSDWEECHLARHGSTDLADMAYSVLAQPDPLQTTHVQADHAQPKIKVTAGSSTVTHEVPPPPELEALLNRLAEEQKAIPRYEGEVNLPDTGLDTRDTPLEKPFYVGMMPESIEGHPSLPLLLKEGRHKFRRPDGGGSGRVHIEGRHGNWIRKQGYRNAQEYIAATWRNKWELFKKPGGNSLFMTAPISPGAKTRDSLVLHLQPAGDHYQVTTAGPWDTKQLEEMELLWSGDWNSRMASAERDTSLSQSGADKSGAPDRQPNNDPGSRETLELSGQKIQSFPASDEETSVRKQLADLDTQLPASELDETSRNELKEIEGARTEGENMAQAYAAGAACSATRMGDGQ